MNKAETKKYINEIIEKTAEMCFCKSHTCKRCEYVEVLNPRCSNENLRNEILKKLKEFKDKSAQSLKGEGEKKIRICPNCEEEHNEDDLNGFCSASCLQGLE